MGVTAGATYHIEMIVCFLSFIQRAVNLTSFLLIYGSQAKNGVDIFKWFKENQKILFCDM